MNQELIDKHRDINVDYEWWDFTYADFGTICDIVGIELDKSEPSFSGFCSQGDGASFTGSYRFKDDAPAKIREHAPQDEELHRIADQLCLVGRMYYPAYVTMRRIWGSRSIHECTMYVNDVEPIDGDADDWAHEVHDAVEREVQDLMRDLARWLYRSLEAEYEHLTSDEVVWEAIVANELHVMQDA